MSGGEINMLERVARALCATHIRNVRRHDTEYHRLEEMLPMAVDAAWPEFTHQARIAIAAMRDPTSPMIDRFVSRALCVSIHGEGGWSDYAVNQWQAMIDAALAEGHR